MKFYFYPHNSNKGRLMEMSEVRERLSERQIEEAEQAKREDPWEEVSYMTAGGMIVADF